MGEFGWPPGLEGEIVTKLFGQVLAQAEEKGLTSAEHFSGPWLQRHHGRIGARPGSARRFELIEGPFCWAAENSEYGSLTSQEIP